MGCDGVDLNRNFQFEWGAPRSNWTSIPGLAMLAKIMMLTMDQ